MDDDLPEDNITKARDILRKNPHTTPKELKEALNLSNNAVAAEILKSAVRAEQDLRQKLAAEDAAAQTMGERPMEQRVYLRDRESGHSYPVSLVSETPRLVVMELDDENVKLSK